MELELHRAKALPKKKRQGLMRGYYDLYLLLIPGLLYLLIFKYMPMYGIAIAFQDYNIFDGISGSKWVGFQNFAKMFTGEDFYKIFTNTLILSVYKILFLFPLPILMAILLNEIRHVSFRKITQTIVYIPHFLSWVIVASIFSTLLSPTSGLVNQLISNLGGEPISFLMSQKWFRTVMVICDGWKETGYSAVVYIAAIAGIDQQLYEAATVDGAGRIRQIFHITLPGISTTIVLLLVLRLGSILEAGTEQLLLMYNPTVYEVGDVIGTYVYRMGLGKQQYSFTTAVGLFNSVVGLILVVAGNFVSRKISGSSIW